MGAVHLIEAVILAGVVQFFQLIEAVRPVPVDVDVSGGHEVSFFI
jgi:hypothetical protein